MNNGNRFIYPAPTAERGVSRRGLIRTSAKVAGAAAVLGSGLSKPLFADEDDEDERRESHAQPLPIPHITSPAPGVNLHFFFPGPVEGTAAPTDPTGAHPNGRDPSTIRHFNGYIGEADLKFSGTGTDLETGAESPYDFEADLRFMKGTFIGSDERKHQGTFSFI
jgi:hypothetical protein